MILEQALEAKGRIHFKHQGLLLWYVQGSAVGFELDAAAAWHERVPHWWYTSCKPNWPSANVRQVGDFHACSIADIQEPNWRLLSMHLQVNITCALFTALVA